MLSAWSVFALIAVGLCAAVAINHSLLSLTWTQTQLCADAAALAGCRELLSDDLLRDDNDLTIPEDRAAQCRSRALGLAQRHVRTGRPVPLLRQQDVDVLQRVWHQKSACYVSFADSLRPDMVRVRLSNRHGQDPSGKMVLAGLSGVNRGIISCEATAWLHSHVSGFCTAPGVAVPMAPLAIPEDPEGSISGTWWATDDPQSPDEYGWDETVQDVSQTADGLYELRLSIHRGDAQVMPGQLVPVRICRSRHPNSCAYRMQHGLEHEETTAAGLQRLSFPRTDSIYGLNDDDFDSLADLLPELIGEKRIFPLVDLSASSENIELTRVVAARILDVRNTSRDEIQVWLQPTVMSPASAVVCRDRTAPANRYVRRITLLR